MKIRLNNLTVHTQRTIERIEFSEVTFIYGPVGKGKSTVARLIDYCLGGELERTPAIQREFVAATLSLILGEYDCTIERSVVVKIVVAFDQNFLPTEYTNHDEWKVPDARRLPEGTFVICRSKSPFGPSASPHALLSL